MNVLIRMKKVQKYDDSEKISFDNMAQQIAGNRQFLGNSEKDLRVPASVLVDMQPERKRQSSTDCYTAEQDEEDMRMKGEEEEKRVEKVLGSRGSDSSSCSTCGSSSRSSSNVRDN